MTFADAIKQKVAGAGASAIRSISNINPYAGGTIAHAVDVVGKALGNPLPEMGATEAAQSAGGYAKMNAATTPAQKAAVEQQAQNTAGFSSAAGTNQNVANTVKSNTVSAPGYNPNTVSELRNERSMGANVGDVRDFSGTKWRWNGVNWEQQGGSAGSAPQVLGAEDVKNIARGVPGISESNLSSGDIEDIMSKYSGATADRAGEIAADLERRATENANREYDQVLSALGVQKGEVNTIAEQQRQRAIEGKALTETDLGNKQTQELQGIEKQKTGYVQESQQNKETLARNWRDLSLETQRIMRARGVSDSEFASSKESKLLLDFNAGLRAIATKEQGAFQDFADAVNNTNSFYTQEKAKLDLESRSALQDIDTWVRQRVQDIQSQEGKALVTKLNEINDAIGQAKQIRLQTEQAIADKQLSFGTWLAQMQYNYKTAVATAAQGNVADATKKINEAKAMFDLTSSILKNGGEVQYDANSKQYFVHGKNPTTGEDVYSPITTGGAQTVLNQTVADQINAIKGGNPLATVQPDLYGNVQNQVYSAAGAPPPSDTASGLNGAIGTPVASKNWWEFWK